MSKGFFREWLRQETSSSEGIDVSHGQCIATLPESFCEVEAIGHLMEQGKFLRAAEQLREQCTANPPDFSGLDLIEGGYSRNIMVCSSSGAELMVARWAEGARTPIHGHPDFAYYHLLGGRLGVEEFTLEKGQPVLKNSLIMNTGDFFSQEGVPGRFDNCIHRITALEESFSFHMYSDDGLKGQLFQESGSEPLFSPKSNQQPPDPRNQ